MRIEITEETGIRHEGFGHMQQGEIREVPDHLGKFFVSNGWAKDVDGKVRQGARGDLDYEDPAVWGKAPIKKVEAGKTTKGVIKPHDASHQPK